MKRSISLAVILALLVVLPGLAAPAGRAQHVLLVSIDGARPDGLRQVNLSFLLADAAYTWNAQTIFPSKTIPAHTSMLTGLTPERHGVLFNEWQPSLGYVKVPTIFTVARQAGLRTAMFTGKDKFGLYADSAVVDKFESVPYYLDRPGYPRTGKTMDDVAKAAATHIVSAKPHLTFVHFADPDSVGHDSGWMSRPYLQALQRVPSALLILVRALREAGIEQQTLIVVTSDHGGKGRDHGTRDPEDMTIPWMAVGPGVKKDHQIQAPVVVYDTAPTILTALGLPLPAMDGKPLMEIFTAFRQPLPVAGR